MVGTFSSLNISEIKQSAGALFMKVGGVLSHFILIYLISNYYGVYEVGLFALVSTLIQFGVILGKMGMDNAVMKFQSESYAVGDKVLARRFYWYCSKNVAIGSIIVAFSFYLLKDFFASFFNNTELKSLAIYISLSIPPLALTYLVGESLKSKRKISASIFFNSVSRYLIAIIIIFFYSWFFKGVNVVIVYSIAIVFTFIMTFRHFQSNWPIVKFPTLDQGKIVKKFAVPLLLVSLIQVSAQQINIIILGAMSDELQVGYFSVIQRISMVMTLPLFAINAVITPLISRHFKNGEFNKLKRSVKRMSLFALVSTLPFFLLVFTFPKIPLTFFGQEYSELGLALIVISIGQLINVSAGSVGYVLQLCDKHILYRNIILATVIIIIMSSIILG